MIVYKRTYNEDRGLPEPIQGGPVVNVQCPTCGSHDMHLSAHPDDPGEILGYEMVRCGHCGRIADYFEAHMQYHAHYTETPREVVGE